MDYFSIISLLIIIVAVLLAAIWRSPSLLAPPALVALLAFPANVFRPLYLLVNPADTRPPPITEGMTTEVMFYGLLVFLIGYIAYWLGYLSGLPFSIRVREIRILAANLWFSEARLTIAVIFLLTCSIIIWLYFVNQVGDFGQFVAFARRGGFEGMKLFDRLPVATMYLASLLLVTSIRSTPMSNGRRGHVARSFALFGLAAVVVFGFGNRSPVLYGSIIVAIGLLTPPNYMTTSAKNLIHMLLVGKVRLYKAAGVLMVVSLVFVMVTPIRSALFAGDYDLTSLSFQSHTGQHLGSRLSTYFNVELFDYRTLAVHDFNYSNYRMGIDFWRGLQGLVPRAVWSEKPQVIMVGGVIRDLYHPGIGGKPIGSIGEWYINFGYPGIIVGLFIGGVVASLLWGVVLRSAFHSQVVVLYLILAFHASLTPGSAWLLRLAEISIPLTVALAFAKVIPKKASPASTVSFQYRSGAHGTELLNGKEIQM